MSGGKRPFGPLFLDGAAPSTQLLTGYLELLPRTLDRLNTPELCAAHT